MRHTVCFSSKPRAQLLPWCHALQVLQDSVTKMHVDLHRRFEEQQVQPHGV
jgi:hypothetical protein